MDGVRIRGRGGGIRKGGGQGHGQSEQNGFLYYHWAGTGRECRPEAMIRQAFRRYAILERR